MILKEIQTQLEREGPMSLTQLVTRFGIEAPALQGMLTQLVRKGRVQRLSKQECCHGCVSCPPEALEFYCCSDDSK